MCKSFFFILTYLSSLPEPVLEVGQLGPVGVVDQGLLVDLHFLRTKKLYVRQARSTLKDKTYRACKGFRIRALFPMDSDPVSNFI